MSDGRTAICPGTYDPVTNGHLDIITRAARVFDRVVVGVVNQPVRKQTTLFTGEERRDFIQHAVSQNQLDNVTVAVFSSLLVEFARDQEAGAIVKGLRAISDFEYEFEMNQLNRKLAPEIESVYIIASPEYSFLSSTGVKEMATFGGNVSDLVPGRGAGPDRTFETHGLATKSRCIRARSMPIALQSCVSLLMQEWILRRAGDCNSAPESPCQPAFPPLRVSFPHSHGRPGTDRQTR